MEISKGKLNKFVEEDDIWQQVYGYLSSSREVI